MHQKTYLDIIEESRGYTEILFILYVPRVSTKESYKNIFVLDRWSNYEYQVYSQMMLCVPSVIMDPKGVSSGSVLRMVHSWPLKPLLEVSIQAVFAFRMSREFLSFIERGFLFQEDIMQLEVCE